MGPLLLYIEMILLLLRGVITLIVLVIAFLAAGFLMSLGIAVVAWILLTIAAFAMCGIGTAITKV